MSDKISLNPQQLTLRDLKRAKTGPLSGRDPFEVLSSGEVLEIGQLVAWCVRSRDDPEFTWDDAGDLTLGDFEIGDGDQPPPTASPAAPGGSDAKPESANSTTRPPKQGRKENSATTSA